ncbi:MAG TPA: NUDIX domain-containing protein [Candidatus Dojkabacteria bacterium]|nr:NUDIX domain-containing protein [Candidatus Dojkabacteria bacterium]
MDFSTPILSVLLLPIKDNKIFLIKRANTGWEDGKWSIPGGRVELGFSIKETALKELKEETAIELSDEDLKLVHIEYLKDKFINFFFSFAPNDLNIIPQENDKVSEFGWFELVKLPEPIAANGRRVLDLINKGELFSE